MWTYNFDNETKAFGDELIHYGKKGMVWKKGKKIKKVTKGYLDAFTKSGKKERKDYRNKKMRNDRYKRIDYDFREDPSKYKKRGKRYEREERTAKRKYEEATSLKGRIRSVKKHHAKRKYMSSKR